MRALLLCGALAICSAPAHSEDSRDPVAVGLIECAPQTLEASVVCLSKHLPEESQDDLRNNGTALAHFGLGMWLRNNWELWGEGPLAQHFNQIGIRHPDDMSSIILDSFVAQLRGEEYDLDAKVAYYNEYWADASQQEEVTCENERDRKDDKVKCYVDGNDNYFTEIQNGEQ